MLFIKVTAKSIGEGGVDEKSCVSDKTSEKIKRQLVSLRNHTYLVTECCHISVECLFGM